MAIDTLAFVGKHEGTAHFLLAEHDAALKRLVERGVVALQGVFVERDGNAPEQREVQFLLRVAVGVGHQRAIYAAVLTLTTPPFRIKGALDERGVSGVQALAGNMAIAAEHTVLRMHGLRLQRANTGKATAEFREVSTAARGLNFTERRTYRLAGQLTIRQRQFAGRYRIQAYCLDHEGAGIATAERIFPVESRIRTAIPEQASEKPSVDDGRRIATRDLTQGLTTAVEHIALARLTFVSCRATRCLYERATEGAVRTHYVVRGVKHLGMSVFRVFQAMQREIGVVERLVVTKIAATGTLADRIGRRDDGCVGGGGQATESAVATGETDIAGAGVHLVRDAVVRTAGKMAGGTSYAVATGLLVPEEGLAEQQGVLTIHDNARQIRQRHVVGLQTAQRNERIHQGAHTHLPCLVELVNKHANRSSRMGHAGYQWQGIEHRQHCGGGFMKVHGAS